MRRNEEKRWRAGRPDGCVSKWSQEQSRADDATYIAHKPGGQHLEGCAV